jgi:hypothetical protein
VRVFSNRHANSLPVSSVAPFSFDVPPLMVPLCLLLVPRFFYHLIRLCTPCFLRLPLRDEGLLADGAVLLLHRLFRLKYRGKTIVSRRIAIRWGTSPRTKIMYTSVAMCRKPLIQWDI